MSKEIDERVVSMQFDNALFEKNIQKSLKSIDDLNKSLNNLDGAKGFEELSKAAKQVDLTPIIASAKNAEKSFSALEIAGITTISRLTNSLINFGAKMGKNFWNATIGQIKSGGWKRASDIKAGKFMLEGLGLGDKNVELLSEAAQKAVKGTAAGLGEAMKSAGVLATSGLKDAKKMEETLKGIAGMSAMTGRSFENIANIYSTVASNGKLMTMQMRQFSFAGINVAAELAKQMNKTEAEINDMVTKGQIDFQTFADAMTKAFGEHAKDANKTFTGALANMKAALSRIGEKFATPFMDNAKDVFNVLRVFFDSVKDAMAPIHEDFEKLMKVGNVFVHKVFSPFVERVVDLKGNVSWEAKQSKTLNNIVEGVRNLYSIIILVIKAVGDAVKEVFPPLEDSSEGFKDLTAALVPSKQGLLLFKEALALVLEVIKPIGTVIKYAITGLRYLIQIISAVVRSVTGMTGGISELLSKIRQGIHDFKIFETILDIVMIAIMGIGSAAVAVVGAISKLFKKIGEFFKFDDNGLRNIGINIINGICKGLETGFEFLKKVWNGIIEFLPNSIATALKIKSPSRVMMGVGENVVAGVVKGLENGESGLEHETDDINSILGKIVNFGLTIADTFGKIACGAIEGLIGLFKKFTGKVDDTNLKKTTADLIETKEVMNDIYMASNDSVTSTTQEVRKSGDSWIETNKEIEQSTETFGDKVGGAYTTLTDKIKELGINLDACKLVLAGFGIALVATFSHVALGLNMFSGLGRAIATVSIIAGAFLLLKEVNFDPLIEGIKELYHSIKNFVVDLNVFENIEKFINRIRTLIQNTNMIMLAGKALAFSFAIVLIRMLHNITTLALNISGAFSSIGKMLKNLTDIKFGIRETNSDKVLKFAIAISAIVTSLTLLGQAFANSKDYSMEKAIGVVAGILLFVSIFAAVTAKISKTKGQAIMAASAMKTVQSISWAILALVTSFIFLAAMLDGHDNNMTALAAAIVSFAAVLGTFGIFLNMINGLDVKVSALTVLSLCALIAVMGKMMNTFVSTFKDVKDVVSASQMVSMMVKPMITAFAGLALILGMLHNFEKTSSKKNGGIFGKLGNIFGTMSVGNEKSTEQSAKFAENTTKILIGMTVMLAAMAGLFKAFAKFKPEEYEAMSMGLIMMIGTFGAMCMIAKHYAASIDMMTEFARDLIVGVLAFTIAMRVINGMSEAEYDTAYIRIAQISATILGILILFSLLLSRVWGKIDEINTKITGIGVMLTGMAIGLAALGAVFSFIPEERLNKFARWSLQLVAIISKLTFAINTINLVMNKLVKSDHEDNKSMFINIAGLVMALATCMASLVILSLLDPASLAMPLVSVGLILMLLTNVVEKVSRIKDVEQAKKLFNALAVMIGFLSTLMLTLTLIPIDRGRLMAVSGSISAVLISLALVIYYISSLNDIKINKSVLITLGIVSGVLAAMFAVMGVMAYFANGNELAVSSAMLIVMYAFTRIMRSISELDHISINKTVRQTILTVGLILGAISLALGVMTWIAKGDAAGNIAAMAFVILSLSVLMNSIKALDGIKINKSALDALRVMTGVIIAIGIAIAAISTVAAIKPESVILTVSAMAVILIAVIGMFTVLNALKIDTKVIQMLMTMMGIFLILGMVISALSLLPTENVGKATQAIAIITAIALAMSAIASVIGLIPGADAAMSAFALVLVGLGVAMISFGVAALAFSVGLKLIEAIDFDYLADGLSKAGAAMLKFAASFALGSVLVAGGIAVIALATANLTKIILPMLVALGGYLMIGLGKGINSNTKYATKSMAKGMESVIDTAYKVSETASPSKVFRQLGEFLMWGLGLGIIQKIPFVGDSLKAGIEGIANWLKGKADEFEEIGDDWGTALTSVLNEKMGDIGIEIPDINEILSEAGAGFDVEAAAADDAADSLEGYTEATGDAVSGSDKLSDSIASTLDMFTEFNDQALMTSKDVLPAFMSQLEGVAKWRDELASLSARGLGEVIIQELESMGPQAYEKVHALYTMTNSELAMMNIMYKQKLALQNGSRKKIEKSFKKLGDGINETMEESMDELSDTMVDSMEDMGSNMMKALKKQIDYEKVINQVTGFRDNVADKIRSSMSIFEAVNEQEEVKAEELLNNMKEQVKHVGKWSSMIVEMAAKGFDEGLVAMLTDMGPQSYSKVAAFLTMSEEQIAEANRLYEASEQVPEYGADKIVKAFAQAGFTASMGLTDSFLEGLDPAAVEQAMTDLGQRSITALQDAINAEPYNPFGVGEAWAGNFAAGLEAKVDEVKKAAQDLADAASLEEKLEENANKFNAPKYNQGVVLTDKDRKNAKTVSEAEKEIDEQLKAYYDNQAKTWNKASDTTPHKDFNYTVKHPLQYFNEDGYTDVTDVLLDKSIEKVNENLKKRGINIDLTDFVTLSYDENGNNAWTYDVTQLIKNGLFSGLKDLSVNGDDEAKIMMDYVQYLQENAVDEEGFYTAGSKDVKGFIKSINDGKKDANKSGKEFGDAHLSGVAGYDNAGGYGGNAPSTAKVFAMSNAPLVAASKNMALGASLAFTETVSSNESLENANTAGQNLAGAFIISLRDNIANLMDAILNSDDASTPKIRPILDGSGILDSLSDIWKKNPVDLSATMDLDVSTKNRDKSVVDAINGISNKEVVEAVNNLAAIVDYAKNEIGNLSIVMDTGQMVGALTNPLNNSFGKISYQSGRGVI